MRITIIFTVTVVLALAFGGGVQKAEAKSQVSRVTKRVETKQTEIPASSRYVFDRTVSAGRIVREGTGTPGTKTTKTTFTYVNGKLVKERTETIVTKKPDDIVVRISPAGYSKASRSGSFAAKRIVTMNSSAYMANEGAMNPTSRTATGKSCEFGIVAVDPKVIPLHTLMYIEGYGFGVAEDTGGAIKGNKIDLCMNSRSEMSAWGRRKVNVHILRTLTDSELAEFGVKEGVTERVHDSSLLAMSNAEESLPASPVEPQQNGGDPASTPGRSPSEPRPNLPTPLPTNPVTPNNPDSGSAKSVTVVKDVNVRAKPSNESSIVALLMKGDKVTLGDGNGGWYAVTTPSGTRGFIKGDSVGMKGPDSDDFPTATGSANTPKTDTPEPNSATPRRSLVVKRDDVIVRSGPSTSRNKVTTVAQGTKVTVVGSEGDWYKVQLRDGTTGYIRNDMFEAGSDEPAPKATKSSKTSKSSKPDESKANKKKTSKRDEDEEKPAKKGKGKGKETSKNSESSKKESKSSKKTASKKETSEKKPSKKSSEKSSKTSHKESSSKKKPSNKKKG